MTDEFTPDSPADGPADDRGDDPPDSPLPSCPRCNTPVARTTMIGPTEAVAGPCGCRVSPGIVDRSEPD